MMGYWAELYMRDYSLDEKAKKLRDSGLTFNEIGAELGISQSRARQLVMRQERLERQRKIDLENPRTITWSDGLKLKTIRMLEKTGFTSRDDCMTLAEDNLETFRGSIALPGWEDDKSIWRWSDKKLPLSVVNEVRDWLGVKPFVPKKREATKAEIERAIKLLERNGYTVKPNNDGNKPHEPQRGEGRA